MSDFHDRKVEIEEYLKEVWNLGLREFLDTFLSGIMGSCGWMDGGGLYGID